MYSNLFVCVFGIGTVFFGLVCIILLCYLLAAICRCLEKAKEVQPILQNSAAVTETESELKVAATAVIAEELSIPIEQIRIVSFRKR